MNFTSISDYLLSLGFQVSEDGFRKNNIFIPASDLSGRDISWFQSKAEREWKSISCAPQNASVYIEGWTSSTVQESYTRTSPIGTNTVAKNLNLENIPINFREVKRATSDDFWAFLITEIPDLLKVRRPIERAYVQISDMVRVFIEYVPDKIPNKCSTYEVTDEYGMAVSGSYFMKAFIGQVVPAWANLTTCYSWTIQISLEPKKLAKAHINLEKAHINLEVDYSPIDYSPLHKDMFTWEYVAFIKKSFPICKDMAICSFSWADVFDRFRGDCKCTTMELDVEIDVIVKIPELSSRRFFAREL